MASLKALAARIFAWNVHRKSSRWINNPVVAQQRTFQNLIKKDRQTRFGEDHSFEEIKNHSDYTRFVPLRDYEELKPYVERILEGETDVLWPGKPLYFAKTSGTTSGAKYIPITRPSIKEQVRASRNAILNYIHKTGEASFVDGKMGSKQAGYRESQHITFPDIFRRTGYPAGRRIA